MDSFHRDGFDFFVRVETKVNSRDGRWHRTCKVGHCFLELLEPRNRLAWKIIFVLRSVLKNEAAAGIFKMSEGLFFPPMLFFFSATSHRLVLLGQTSRPPLCPSICS